MADIADKANVYIERDLQAALSMRKPVPIRCECGDVCAVLPNGARARFCDDCLIEFQGGAK